jgi:hypothetical protein
VNTNALVRLELHARAHVPRLHGALRAAPREHHLVEEVGYRRHAWIAACVQLNNNNKRALGSLFLFFAAVIIFSRSVFREVDLNFFLSSPYFLEVGGWCSTSRTANKRPHCARCPHTGTRFPSLWFDKVLEEWRTMKEVTIRNAESHIEGSGQGLVCYILIKEHPLSRTRVAQKN